MTPIRDESATDKNGSDSILDAFQKQRELVRHVAVVVEQIDTDVYTVNIPDLGLEKILAYETIAGTARGKDTLCKVSLHASGVAFIMPYDIGPFAGRFKCLVVIDDSDPGTVAADWLRFHDGVIEDHDGV